MKDKVCLITGSNSGIGKETALGLARLGATVVLVCRDATKGEAARAEIAAKAGNDRVALLTADLAVQASVRKLADDFKSRYDRLDVLVNNAGLSLTERKLTPDGIESTFAINHLAPFLLTHLLLDNLKASPPARIVTVSSAAQGGGHINFEDLGFAKGYSEFKAYSQSKLANVLFTYELARRLDGTGVTANCLHPGLVRSNFAGQSKGFFGWMIRLSRPFQISSVQGAQTPIYLASSPDVEGVSGLFFSNKTPTKTSRESYDTSVARRLWEESARLTQVGTDTVKPQHAKA